MLEKIYYVTTQKDIMISKEWPALLKLWNIDFETLSSSKLKECFISSKCLFLCETQKEALFIHKHGGFVVIACNDNNKGEDFSDFPFAVEDFSIVPPIYYIKFWQRFMNIPWHIVDTNRCRIREMTPDDVDALYELYEDKSVTRFMEDLFEDKQMEREYIEKYIQNIYSYFGFGTWVIIRKEDNKMIGRAGFNYRPEFDEPELGFMIGAKYQHLGYAYEVCRKLMNYAKEELGFETMQALVEPKNTASIQLLKKLGFGEEKMYQISDITYIRFLT